MFKTDEKWLAKQILGFCGFSLLLGYILYNSVWGIFAVLPVIPYMFKLNKKKYVDQEKKIFLREFKEAIEHISANLNAGYSLENAVVGACVEMNKDTSETKYIGKQLEHIVNGVKYSYSVEELFVSLGEECDLDEVKEFGGLLSAAKKYGGNIMLLIKQTRDNITQKSIVELETDTTIASKRLEGQVMLVMPFAIVLYMKLTNSSYIDGLYQGVAGRVVMTVVFFAWFFAKCMIDKIVNDVAI